MIVARLLLVLVMPFVAAGAALGPGSGAGSPGGIEARLLLLSPTTHRGQVFAWTVALTDRAVDSSQHGPVRHFDHLNGIASCIVVDESKDSITVSRRFTMTLLNGKAVRHTVVQPNIVIRNGHEFNISGSALLSDPICKFYSASMFGDPSRYLRPGASWDFRQPSNFRGAESVRVTVVSVDRTRHRISLHIVARDPKTKALRRKLDVVIVDGGLIESEVDSDSIATASAFPKNIGTPSSIAVFKLQHS